MEKEAKNSRVKVTISDSGTVTITTNQKRIVVIITEQGNVTTMASDIAQIFSKLNSGSEAYIFALAFKGVGMAIVIYHPKITVKATVASNGEIVLTVEPP